MKKHYKKMLRLVVTLLLPALIVIVAFPAKITQAEQPEITQQVVADAYARFKSTAMDANIPLSSFSYGHKYIIEVADYYQVYVNENNTAAIIICDVMFDGTKTPIKFDTSIDYYPGLDSIKEQLKYMQNEWPECFAFDNTNTPTQPEQPTEQPSEQPEPEQPEQPSEQPGQETEQESTTIPSDQLIIDEFGNPIEPNYEEALYGVGVDDDEDGVYDRYVKPDGVTAYMPEEFNNQLTFQMYVIEHLDIYDRFVTITTTGEVYWKESGDYIGLTEDGGGHGF